MSDRVKRVLFAVGFLLLAGAIAAAMYWVFFRGGFLPGTTPGTGGTTPGTGTLSPAGPGGNRPVDTGETGTLPGTSGTFPETTPSSGTEAPPQTALLRDGVTQGVSASTDGRGARYYNPDDDLFYRVSTDGTIVALSNQTFPRATDVSWANSTDQAIITFPDDRKVHYDFRTKKQATLPSHWEGFSFSPDDRQVISKSLAVSPDSRFLTVSNADGSNPQAVEPLGENADLVFPTWTPNNQIVAYALVGGAQGLDRQEVLMVGKNHENFRALQVEGRGFLPLWSPDGNTVLYSVWNSSSEYRPELWVSGGSAATLNQNRTKLGLTTWADKCAWKDTVTIYCAVPTNLPRGAGLQPEIFRNLPDAFYKIDLRSGTQTLLGEPEGAAAAVNLVVTDNGDAIFFTDAQTGRLYQFNLP